MNQRMYERGGGVKDMLGFTLSLLRIAFRILFVREGGFLYGGHMECGYISLSLRISKYVPEVCLAMI